jgi:hypothetical protein
LLQQIAEIRTQQPRCGGRKLFIMLHPFFKQHSIIMGRDNFFDLLRQNKLLARTLSATFESTLKEINTGQIISLTKDSFDVRY